MGVIPSMGGEGIGRYLARYASEVPEGEAIVEVGCWLGAGTRHLAPSGREMHVYDQWKARTNEVAHAAKSGVMLTQGQDTLPWVKGHLKPFTNIIYHKGQIQQATYDGPTIGLYVDDASKRNWPKISRIFTPHFRKGTVLVMMDYHFAPCHEVLKAAMQGLEVIEQKIGTSTAVFRWQ